MSERQRKNTTTYLSFIGNFCPFSVHSLEYSYTEVSQNSELLELKDDTHECGLYANIRAGLSTGRKNPLVEQNIILFRNKHPA